MNNKLDNLITLGKEKRQKWRKSNIVNDTDYRDYKNIYIGQS